MDTADYARLEKMLASLSPRVRETARVCWDECCYSNRWEDWPIGGVKYAAWIYAATIHSGPKEVARITRKKTPNIIEEDLNSLVATIRDLKLKLNQVQKCPEILKLIEIASTSPRTLPPSAMTPGHKDLVNANVCLSTWFPLRRKRSDSSKTMEDAELSGRQFETRINELETLAQSLEVIVQEAANKKQARNGRREGLNGREWPIELLLSNIGMIVRFRARKLSHVIPIARKVHEWVTGDTAGDYWGDRPFERVEPMLRALRWEESDGERAELVNRLKFVPFDGMSPFEWFTAKLMAGPQERVSEEKGGTPPPT